MSALDSDNVSVTLNANAEVASSAIVAVIKPFFIFIMLLFDSERPEEKSRERITIINPSNAKVRIFCSSIRYFLPFEDMKSTVTLRLDCESSGFCTIN